MITGAAGVEEFVPEDGGAEERRRLVRIQHGGQTVICRMPWNMRHLQCPVEEKRSSKTSG